MNKENEQKENIEEEVNKETNQEQEKKEDIRNLKVDFGSYEVKKLYELFRFLSKLDDDVKITIENGIAKIKLMDKAMVSYTEFEFEGFVSCNKEKAEIFIPAESIFRILSKLYKNQYIDFKIENGKVILENDKVRFEVNLVEGVEDNNDFEIEELEKQLDSEIEVYLDDLLKVIRFAQAIGSDDIKLVVNSEGKIVSEGDMAKVEYKELIDYSGEGEAKYPSSYLEILPKVDKLIKIRFGTEKPLLLELETEVGKLKYALAPRVSE